MVDNSHFILASWSMEEQHMSYTWHLLFLYMLLIFTNLINISSESIQTFIACLIH